MSLYGRWTKTEPDLTRSWTRVSRLLTVLSECLDIGSALLVLASRPKLVHFLNVSGQRIEDIARAAGLSEGSTHLMSFGCPT